jgi:hypothetical protein
MLNLAFNSNGGGKNKLQSAKNSGGNSDGNGNNDSNDKRLK